MNLITLASRGAALTVAGVAGFASYRHIVDVALDAGEHRSVALVLPLAIDGLIVVGTMAMLADKRDNRYVRLSARVALVVGVVATLAANIASANPTVTARLVAAVPAVAFLLSVEVLARRGKPRPDVPPPVAPVADPVPVSMIEPASGSVPISATAPPVPAYTPEPDPAPAAPVDDRRDRAAARKAYRASATAGRPLSGAALARQFGRSPRWGVDRVNEVREAERRAQERARRPAGTVADADSNGHSPEPVEATT